MFARAVLTTLAVLACAATTHAAPPAAITMGEAVPFAPDVAGEVGLLAPGGTTDSIQQRCGLPQAFSQSIADELRHQGIDVTTTSKPDEADGPVLNVIIEGVLGFSGAWKGPKTLVLRGELRQGETILGSFVVRKSNGMGALFKNSCEEFVTLGQKAAADIGKWARAPKVRARLGSA
jgi:hypothetical protein